METELNSYYGQNTKTKTWKTQNINCVKTQIKCIVTKKKSYISKKNQIVTIF